MAGTGALPAGGAVTPSPVPVAPGPTLLGLCADGVGDGVDYDVTDFHACAADSLPQPRAVGRAGVPPPANRTGLQLTLHSLDMSKRESRVS